MRVAACRYDCAVVTALYVSLYACYFFQLPRQIARDFACPAGLPPPPGSDQRWPFKKAIQGVSVEFANVTFRYRAGLPAALKSVNFAVQPGEKVGEGFAYGLGQRWHHAAATAPA